MGTLGLVRPFFVQPGSPSVVLTASRRKGMQMKNFKINDATTFAELKAMFPETKKGKKPTAKGLMENGTAVHTESSHGADIVIYENGYLTYSRDDRTTVASIWECSKLYFEVEPIDEELEHLSEYGIEKYYDRDQEKLRFFRVVSDVDNLPWQLPICMFCDDKLMRNQESREQYRSRYSIDGKKGEDWTLDYVWEEGLKVEDFVEKAFEAMTLEDFKQELLEKLRGAMTHLTDKQKDVLLAYYAEDDNTDAAVGRLFNISQQGVNKHRKAGFNKLVKLVN